MPIVLALLAALGGAYIWYLRANSAREAGETLLEVANDVRLAARRFGFRRKANIHPVESLDDVRLAVASVTAALMQIDKVWTREMGQALGVELQAVYDLPAEESREMVVFAHWMAGQCGTMHEAVRRIGKRLAVLGGKPALANVRHMAEVLIAPDENYSEPMTEAIEALRRHFR